MEKPRMGSRGKLYRTGLLNMKKYILTFFILITAFSGVYSQSNYPMAEIITGQKETPAVIQEQEQKFITPRLYWEGASRARTAQQIKTGERVTLVLRAAGWSSPAPTSAFFMPEVPRDVILASAPVSADERFNGILIKLTLIPLKEGVFNLPARTLQHEKTLFEIPNLTIRIISGE